MSYRTRNLGFRDFYETNNLKETDYREYALLNKKYLKKVKDVEWFWESCH